MWGEETERHASVYNCVVRKTFVDAERAGPTPGAAGGLRASPTLSEVLPERNKHTLTFETKTYKHV